MLKKIYEIDDAKIYTDLVENVAIIKDKVLIKKFHFNKLMVNLNMLSIIKFYQKELQDNKKN